MGYGLKVGIIGLPNVGKSTLFNALLKKRLAQTASYPFTTIEPNIGVVAVPDLRLEKLAELVKKEKDLANLPPIVPASIEFVDIAGLVKGAHQGEGLGNQFLAHIREVDAILHVLRDFGDENVPGASYNPESDKLIIETELALSDLETVDKLITAQEGITKKSKDQIETKKLQVLNQIKSELEKGQILGKYHLGDERLKDYFGHLPLLTLKPTVYVLNVSENNLKQKVDRENINENEVVISAKLEEELIDYPEVDRKEYLKSFGVDQTGLERLIIKAFKLLDLISFFTTKGGKEVRAWPAKNGTKAIEAARMVHTDFAKNFIKTQVIEYHKLIEAGSFAESKAKGLVITEGKDYEVKDGDVVEFLVGS